MRVLEAGRRHRVELIVNGRATSGQAEPRLLASDFIRHELGLTGTHVGCEHGVCGACTVLVDGEPQRACLLYAVQLEGKTLATVEGLANADGSLSDLHRALRKHHGLQCGFCTPGVLVSLTHLLAHEDNLSESRVRDVLSGHLCRCTGYETIVNATLEVTRSRQSDDASC